ncbi:MAG: anthranilate synthase component I family protein [Myxococcaceae bacterium]
MREKSQLSFAEFDRLAAQGDFIPVWREIPGDTETPVSAFMKLPSPETAFLLESVEAGERWGRFSFLGDSPIATLQQRGGNAELLESGRKTLLPPGPEKNPLLGLRERLSRYRFVRAAGLPPFVGGWVGYLGWAAVHGFEPRVPQRLGSDPQFPDGEWMLAGRLIVFDNLSHTLKLIACVDTREHGNTRRAYDAACANLDTLESALEKPLAPRPLPTPVTDLRDGWSKSDFEAAVRRVREYIAAGDCMQVVLSRRVTGHYSGDAFALYRGLRRISPTPYLFFLRFGTRALAGASPELLVRVQGDVATVRPIAGTRARGRTPEEDAARAAQLAADPKERAEHVMLVDLGRNDIGRVSQGGTVRVEEREVIERYSHVMHLVSQVSGKLRPGLDGLDVLAATFPAGTVSGAPKVRAMQIIDELEPVPRGPYAGAVGYIGWDGNCDLAIAIRTLALSGTELRLHAGAGIVHDSDPEREYDETEHKLRAARVAVGAPP